MTPYMLRAWQQVERENLAANLDSLVRAYGKTPAARALVEDAVNRAFAER